MLNRSLKGWIVLLLLAVSLSACKPENQFMPPPPAEISVAPPLQQQVAPFEVLTGNTVSFATVDLVARVEGFLTEIKYTDGALVKKGDTLFGIEQTMYKAKVKEADAGLAAAKAALVQADAEFTRPAPPVSRLRFETTKGVFVLELHRDWGPLGADRLYNLARLGYFTDTRFHRVRAAYIAQWGLHGDSAVNAAWKGRYLRDDPPRSRNTRGTFAFSYEGPGRENTRNTQIYVNLADNPRNDAEPFTMLGTVVEGMAVLDSLYSGYGEDAGSGVRQGKQGPLERGGNAYMDREFPKLDRIFRVVISLH